MDPSGFPSFNTTQERFHELCRLGGGQRGGPARTKVQQLLQESGESLNTKFAYGEVGRYLDHLSEFDPWHVCFAIGLCWGHLADMNEDFVGAAVRVLREFNSADLCEAKRHHYERGPEPIEQSLIGGHMLFDKVKLPPELPLSLREIGRAQERWLGRVVSKDRPKYIGSWNAIAMCMVAVFAQPALARTMIELEFMLPPGGPIYSALQLLNRAQILSKPPEGTELDDENFQPGSIYLRWRSGRVNQT